MIVDLMKHPPDFDFIQSVRRRLKWYLHIWYSDARIYEMMTTAAWLTDKPIQLSLSKWLTHPTSFSMLTAHWVLRDLSLDYRFSNMDVVYTNNGIRRISDTERHNRIRLCKTKSIDYKALFYLALSGELINELSTTRYSQ